MSQESSLHRRMLIAALIVFTQDLSCRGGAQAWTYNYSIIPNRSWPEARQWCQQHSTDMVAMQNQEETDFMNNLLPFNANYYWIGVRKVNGVWTCDGTNQDVSEIAQNWASGEPDNLVGQDCVEIYIKRGKDTAKWNNEKCNKKKGTVCYSASCKKYSCSAHAACVETIGSYTCQCHPGFLGPRCEEAIACKPLPEPEQGSHSCFHPYGSNRLNTSCRFHCELGFRLFGSAKLVCQSNGEWNHPVPLCQVEQCPVLNHTDISGGSMKCSHPIAPYSYNSTCEVRCHEGYERHGVSQLRCRHTGQWTASVPACTVKKCSPVFFPVMGNMTCVDTVEPFSFGSQCNFTCQEGYYLSGDSSLTCLASGQWSKPTPTCTVVQCNRLEAPPHASMQCQDPVGVYSYGSKCSVYCEEGFYLIGAGMTKCSSQGNWSHQLPICQARRCSPINIPPHGSLSCSDPNGSFSFGSRCTSTCDEGFLLNGTASTECTSLGTWSADIPHCLAESCPPPNSPPHGSLSCSGPHGEFSFGSRCTSACEEGFVLNGTAVTECTSLGTWSTDFPHCLAKRCPPLNSPPHGSLSCSGPHGQFSFSSQCTSTCDQGFLLNGTADTDCTSVGKWSRDVPRCLAQRCPPLNSPPHGSLSCSDPHGEFSFGSLCTSACEEGFLLNGTANTKCTSQGTWSSDIPLCLAERCPSLNSPPHGFLSCSDPHGEFTFGSRCTLTCEEGFAFNGTADTECTSVGTWSKEIPHCLAKGCPTLFPPAHGIFSCSNPHGEFRFGSRCTLTCEEGFVLSGMADIECTHAGTWSREIPHCLATPCSLLAKAPQHGRMNCSHPYSPFSYDSHCDFECNEGFWLRGTPSMKCDKLGHWSQQLPTCQRVQCKAIQALSLPLSMNCSHPWENFSFGSQCLFTCAGGFSLNGTEVLLCSSAGVWSGSLPHCTEDKPVGASNLLNSGVGVAIVALPFVLISLASLIFLILTRFKKRETPIMSDVPTWDETENPAFEF